jgi:hypothetical protein
MRETLHQLTLTLALPIAVGAVWIARAERAEPPTLERATAYRVELADLPLPVRERLRIPGFAAPTPVARRAPEDSAPRRDRPLLGDSSLPAPVELAVDTDSKRDVVAAPSPRAAEEALVALPLASQAALGTAPHVAPAAPSLWWRRETALAATVPIAASQAAAPPEIAAATGTGKAASGATAAGADPNAWEQDRVTAMQVARSASPQSPQPLGGRGAGAAPVAAPARAVGNSPIVTGDPGKSTPIAATPISTSPVANQSPAERPEDPNGHVPLTPPGLSDRVPDLSWQPDSPSAPSLPSIDLPLPALEHAAANSVDFGPDEPPSSPPIVRLFASPTLVPEPGSAILLGASLAALGALRRSRRRA